MEEIDTESSYEDNDMDFWTKMIDSRQTDTDSTEQDLQKKSTRTKTASDPGENRSESGVTNTIRIKELIPSVLVILLISINLTWIYDSSKHILPMTTTRITSKAFHDPSLNVIDVEKLRRDLDAGLFGQPLVNSLVPKALEKHLENADPQKPLVMTFQGPTGTGKSLVIKHIKTCLSGGDKPVFRSKTFSAIGHCHQNNGNEKMCKKHVLATLNQLMLETQHGLFIFEDFDDIPEAKDILKSIKVFLGNHISDEAPSFAKSIFVFVSRNGSTELKDHAYKMSKHGQNDWRQAYNAIVGKIANAREASDLFNVINSYVDYRIPFLPMDSDALNGCIKSSLHKLCPDCTSLNLKLVSEEILREEIKWPTVDKRFASRGCNEVEKKVRLLQHL